MDIEEIKLRRLAAQRLTAGAGLEETAGGLCGIQAQFMSHALHALRIRCTDFSEDAVCARLVKNWTIRGTVHLFPESDLPLFAGGADCRSNDWSAANFWNLRADWALTPGRQSFLSGVVLSALDDSPRSREELRALCRAAGMTPEEERSMFHPWGGGLRQLCERGFMHYAASAKKEFRLSPPFEPLPEAERRLTLARRYFTGFGPATVKDAAYFFGISQTAVKKLLDGLPVLSCECGGRTYYHIENGAPPCAAMPECIYLAGFDQLLLGYEKRESLYLEPENLRSVFNLAGIVMPAVLLHGRVAGRWKRKGARLTVELFRAAGRRDRSAMEAAAERLWSGVRVEFV